VDPGHDRCDRCLFQRRSCLCAQIPQVITATQIVIVRHHSEHDRASNTGRLAHRALPNSVVVEHGAPGTPTVLPPLDGAWVLYPGGAPRTSAPVPPANQLIVLDATWSQARKMFQKLAVLRGLPLLSLPIAPMPAARLRASPGPGQVSTIEAIARALRLLEGDAAAVPLEELFALAVERVRALGERPRSGAS
jgi:DTW domain-containing protein YfiP